MSVSPKTIQGKSLAAAIGRWLLAGTFTLVLLIVLLRAHLGQRNTRFTAELRASKVREASDQGVPPATPKQTPSDRVIAGLSPPIAAAVPEPTPSPSGRAGFAEIALELPNHLTVPGGVLDILREFAREPVISPYWGAFIFPIQDRASDENRRNGLIVSRIRLGPKEKDSHDPQDEGNPIRLLGSPDDFHAWLDRAAAAIMVENLTAADVGMFGRSKLWANSDVKMPKITWWLVQLRAAREGDRKLLDQAFGAPSIKNLPFRDYPFAVLHATLKLVGASSHPETERWAAEVLTGLPLSEELERQLRHDKFLQEIETYIKDGYGGGIDFDQTDIRAHLLDGVPQRGFAQWVKPALDRELEAFAISLIDGNQEPSLARRARVQSLAAAMAIRGPYLDEFAQTAQHSEYNPRRGWAVFGKLLMGLMHQPRGDGDPASVWPLITAGLTPEERQTAAELKFRLIRVPPGLVFFKPNNLGGTQSPGVAQALSQRHRIIGPEDLREFNLTDAERSMLTNCFQETPGCLAIIYELTPPWNHESLYSVHMGYMTPGPTTPRFETKILDR